MSREDGFRDPGLCESCSAAPCLCATMEALRQNAATPITVHILKYGRSYCEMPGIPARWPAKHQWVSFQDNWDKTATCERCRGFAALDPAALRPLTLAEAAAGAQGDIAIPSLADRPPDIRTPSDTVLDALYNQSTITPETRRFLQSLNARGRLVTTEITREGRKRGSPISLYFRSTRAPEDVANKLINVFMRTRFSE